MKFLRVTKTLGNKQQYILMACVLSALNIKNIRINVGRTIRLI